MYWVRIDGKMLLIWITIIVSTELFLSTPWCKDFHLEECVILVKNEFVRTLIVIVVTISTFFALSRFSSSIEPLE